MKKSGDEILAVGLRRSKRYFGLLRTGIRESDTGGSCARALSAYGDDGCRGNVGGNVLTVRVCGDGYAVRLEGRPPSVCGGDVRRDNEDVRAPWARERANVHGVRRREARLRST